jgi:hypothetical protein
MKPSAFSKAIEIVAALFILLFVYTATSKLLAHQAFVISLKKIFPFRFCKWVPELDSTGN